MKNLPSELVPQPMPSSADHVARAVAALQATVAVSCPWLLVLGRADGDGGDLEMFGQGRTEREAAGLAVAALYQWLAVARKHGDKAGMAKASLLLSLSGAHVDGVTGGIVRQEGGH
jgi:hypothetical protein